MSRKKKIVAAVVAGVVIAAAGTYVYVFRTSTDNENPNGPQETALSEPSQKAVRVSSLLNSPDRPNEDTIKQAENLADEAIKTATTNTEKFDAYQAKAATCVAKKDYACAYANYLEAAKLEGSYSLYVTVAEYAEKSANKQSAIEYYNKAKEKIDPNVREAEDLRAFIDARIKALQ